LESAAHQAAGELAEAERFPARAGYFLAHAATAALRCEAWVRDLRRALKKLDEQRQLKTTRCLDLRADGVRTCSLKTGPTCKGVECREYRPS
jgi:hypothetical protein